MATMLQSLALGPSKLAPSSHASRAVSHHSLLTVLANPTPLIRHHQQRCRPLRFKGEDDRESVRTKLEQDLSKVKDTAQEKSEDMKNQLMRGNGPSYSPEAPRVSLLTPAFTRRREVFVGRIAMLGFLAACVWEVVFPDHPGILRQVSGFTGLDISTVGTAFLGIIGFSVVGAIAPWSPTYSQENQQDAAKRPPGPTTEPTIYPNDWRRFLGISNTWGFTKKNELFHGRIAMLGFFAALVQEVRLGGVGPLAQVANLLNVPANDTFYSAATSAFLAFSVFALALSTVKGTIGTMVEPEEDIF